MSGCAWDITWKHSDTPSDISVTSETPDHTPRQMFSSARYPYSSDSEARARGCGAGSTCQASRGAETPQSDSLSSLPAVQFSIKHQPSIPPEHRTLLNKREMILRRLSPNSSRGTACSGLVVAMLASLDPRKMTTISIFPMSSCQPSLS